MAKWEATKMHEYEEDKGKPFNPVDRPIHYGQGKIECIDYIEDFLTREEYIGYLRGISQSIYTDGDIRMVLRT